MRALIVWAAVAGILSAQEYAIRMGRPVVAGQRYNLAATGSMSETYAVADRTLKSTEFDVAFKGAAEVLAVDDKGAAFKIALTVQRFTKTDAGATVDVLKPGTVVAADGSQDQPFSVEGAPLDKSTSEALRLIYSAHKPGEPSDDELFGAMDRKGIGSEWPVNAPLLLNAFSEVGADVAAGHLSGKVALTGIDEIAGVNCLTLEGTMSADHVVPKNIPVDVTVGAGTVEATFHGCYPIDASALSYRTGSDLNMSISASKGGVTLTITRAEKRDATWIEPKRLKQY
jgi:hypothetical protein